MSLNLFITEMLNINFEDIESLNGSKNPDGTLLATIKFCRGLTTGFVRVKSQFR